MRFKIRKGMLSVKQLQLVEPTDVLVCARVLQALPQERLLAAIQQCFKYGFIEGDFEIHRLPLVRIGGGNGAV